MSFFRKHWRAIGSFLALWVAVPIVGEWFIELAREKGVYQHPSERLSVAIDWFTSIADLPGFRPIGILLIGIVIGVWLDTLVRRNEARTERNAPRVKQWLDPVQAIETFIDGELRNERNTLRGRLTTLAASYDDNQRQITERSKRSPFGAVGIGGEPDSIEINKLREKNSEIRSAMQQLEHPLFKKEREILEDLIDQLKRGVLVGKAFRIDDDKIAETQANIPADHWILLNFDTYDLKRETVTGGGRTYKGLQIGLNENRN